MGSFSPIHWIVIGVVALLLFGNRLPEVARSMGRAFREFKRGLSDVGEELGRDEPDKHARSKDRLQAPEDPDRLKEPGEPVSRPREKAPEHTSDTRE